MKHSQSALTVSEITAQIKRHIESRFSHVWVQGEISNFKHHTSGHMYFTVKDSGAELRCVMFQGFNQSIHFKPEDGMDVLLQGKITVYEPRGQYQLMVQMMEPAGIGTLYLAFEALKKQLAAEGLFDEALKKPLPAYPKKIGIVTSRTGAAIRDMLNVFSRRSPYVKIVLRPAFVQGDDAAEDIVNGIHELESLGDMDIIIIGRGGGSLEDLWAFNEEAVARAIAACPIPLISAVGHETDVTISDMVADLRAPTPSAAVELAAPGVTELKDQLTQRIEKLYLIVQHQLNRIWQQLDHLVDRQSLQHPRNILIQKREKLGILSHQLNMSMHHLLSMAKTKLKGFEKELSVLNPADILHRGYSIAFKKNGTILRHADDLAQGATFVLKTGRGSLEAEKKKSLPDED
ncbi:MAG: exodeoxyribonuclease VII large subunit [Candidatus Marinimicrobia bacterium]|jgi:exodeoxyribonuclease VII large subunit|nr:exodeoxyribonuclease VII large subunit [Candidatus Neomarinimicrobiota bacterium]MDP6610913.1 exodeoxyribonuclease VII large subunit [Candidatus Neomarinimicrobiota bacterium]|tara:strand:+ start:32177 stop:33388 length:1212 start_codon:yes stop_codon:yes gene_type:complete